MSSGIDDSLRDRFEQAGIDDFIAMPLRIDELARALQKGCAIRSDRDAKNDVQESAKISEANSFSPGI
jgi:hypothetical protein